MSATAPNWDQIEPTAKALGVSEEAFRKWKERGGVPGKWHAPLVVKSGGALRLEDVAPGVGQ